MEAPLFSFDPSDDQKLLIEAARKFAGKELKQSMRDADEAGSVPSDLTRSGWELGLLPASIPESFGGFGEHSFLTGVLAAEELAWGDLSGALALMAPNLVALPVLLSGSAEQRKELLPAYCTESYVPGSLALMEPRFDFDPQSLSTTSVRDNGGYILSGTKCNVPCAAESDWMLVFAALDGRTEGFLLPRGARGVHIGDREQNMGMKAVPLYRVRLEGCRVPEVRRLGGGAGSNFSLLLNSSRVASAALAVGVARAAYEYGLEYARNRKAFGEAIAQRQSIAFMLAEMATDIEAARLMVWEAAWRLDRNEEATRESYLAKDFADDMALMVCDRSLQILGGHGYIRDYPVELYLRNARGFAVMEGIAMV